MYYTRTLAPLVGDEDVLLAAIGDGTPGTRTKIYRSLDRGATWADTLLHTVPNSTFWAIGTHAADPQLLFAGSNLTCIDNLILRLKQTCQLFRINAHTYQLVY